MKTATSFLLLTVLSIGAGCSSSEGGATGGGSSGGGSSEGGGNQACEGEGCDCPNEPLDCIGGTFYDDENGCLACDYWECNLALCPELSSPECIGDGAMYCHGAPGGCSVLDPADPNLPDCSARYACVDATWTCACPTEVPQEGAPCDDVGQTCEIASDLDCGPPTVTVECTPSGWTEQLLDGGAGGAGGGDGCG